MTDDNTNLPAEAPKRSSPGKVGGRLRSALMAMIWENTPDNEAAVKFGLSVTAIRSAIKKPHVRAFLKGQRDVLLAREAARNPHALIKTRDTSLNGNAVVASVRMLEELAEHAEIAAGSRARPAGLTIIIQQPGGQGQIAHAPAPITIEHEPVASHAMPREE